MDHHTVLVEPIEATLKVTPKCMLSKLMEELQTTEEQFMMLFGQTLKLIVLYFYMMFPALNKHLQKIIL